MLPTMRCGVNLRLTDGDWGSWADAQRYLERFVESQPQAVGAVLSPAEVEPNVLVDRLVVLESETDAISRVERTGIFGRRGWRSCSR